MQLLRRHSTGTYHFSFLSKLAFSLVALVCSGLTVNGGNKTWKNNGTDFNTANNWIGGIPSSNDVAVFDSAITVQPNLSGSVTIQALNFSISGCDLTSSNSSTKLTLTNTGTGTSSAINAANTSGTNTIDAPVILGAAANSTQTFTQAGGGTLIVNGIISNTNSVTLSLAGGGTFQLGGANTYTGGTTLASTATLRINSTTALGTGTFTILGGTIDNTTAGAITLSNNNAQAWNGDFTFTGTQSLNLGTGAVTLGASRTVTVTANTLTVGGVISGSGSSLTKAGNGTLTLSGANTYTGGTTLNAGTLNMNNATAVGSGTFTINGGTIDNTTGGTITLSNNNAQAWNGDFTFAGTRNLNLGTGAVALGASRTITVSANTLTVGGAISGSGFGLTKSGSGTLTLTGTNTFSGSTIVNGGTLTAAGSSGAALGSTSSVTVNSSGTLVLGASNQINNSAGMTLAGGTFAKGNFSEGTTSSVGIGALTLTSGSHIDFGTGTVGTLTFASFSPGLNTLTIDNWTGTANTVGGAGTDRLIFNSDQTSNLSNFWFTGYAPGATEFWLGDGYYEVTPVAIPEASTYIPGALALGLLLCTQLRRIRKGRDIGRG